jgi:hypothetical protein
LGMATWAKKKAISKHEPTLAFQFCFD